MLEKIKETELMVEAMPKKKNNKQTSKKKRLAGFLSMRRRLRL